MERKHGFSHRQGSGYIGDCVNKLDVTNIGRQYNLIDLLKPIDIPLDAVKIND